LERILPVVGLQVLRINELALQIPTLDRIICAFINTVDPEGKNQNMFVVVKSERVLVE